MSETILNMLPLTEEEKAVFEAAAYNVKDGLIDI